jgi:antitoxin ParD1/3/4
MAASEKRTFSLPSEQSQYIDELVESGAYASGSEVVRAGLRALRERDGAVERWLREDVATVYDKIRAGKSATVPAEKVFAAVRARHADRAKKSA